MCTGRVLRMRGLPPSASSFLFLFTFFFTCGLTGLLTTSPTWSWQTGHPRHSGLHFHASHTPARSHAVLASHLCPFSLAGAHLAYHQTHFIKLLKQLVDLLDGRTTATSNTFAPTSIDDLRIASLLFRHREDNRLDMFHLVAFERLFHFWRRYQFVQARD